MKKTQTDSANLSCYKNIDELFALYENKKVDDYHMLLDIEQGVVAVQKVTLVNPTEVISATQDHRIYTPEYIEKFNPDNIDINYFWQKATQVFPLLSICGYNPQGQPTNTEEANEQLLNGLHKYIGALKSIDTLFSNDKEALFMEIGPGHGSIKNYIEQNYSLKNYYAIDVNPLFTYEKLFTCDGRSIPDNIPRELDMVYSVNVFQHLSVNQRDSYYEQVYHALRKGGEFIFSMFMITEENRDVPNLWGHRDVQGKRYTWFFNQYTEAEHIDIVKHKLSTIGFIIASVDIRVHNSILIKAYKP